MTSYPEIMGLVVLGATGSNALGPDELGDRQVRSSLASAATPARARLQNG